MANLATITTNILADSGIDDINVIVSTGSYADPAWITSLAWTKITGAPANIVTGTGTTNYLPKFTGTSTIGNSSLFDGGGFGGFNNTGLGNRTFVINAASGRPLAFEVVEFANVHSIYVRPNNSGFNLISGNYISGGTYLPLSLSARETNSDFVLATNGNIGIGVSPSQRLDVNGVAQFRDDIRFSTTNSSIGYTDSLRFFELGVATRMTLSSGNLGLGVTPSAWNSGYRALQFGTTGALFGENGDAANYFTTNTFVDSVGFKYITSDWALGYFQENGVHSWRTAPSGTAGNAISFTQAMTLDASGRLGIGTPSPAYRLDVVADGGANGISIRNRSVDDYGFLLFNNTNNTERLAEIGVQRVASNQGDLWFTTNSGSGSTLKMKLTASGRLLLGNPPPAESTFTLDVNGTGRFSGNLTGTTASFTSSSTLLTLTSGAGTKAVFATTRNFGVNRNFQIAVDEFSESAFTITPSTTIGGSTYTTPIFTLAAAGAATFSSTVRTAGNVLVPAGSGLAWTGDASRIMTPEDNVQGAKIATPGGFLVEASVFKFIGGNVGIGTTSPNYLLHIAAGAANPQLQFSSTGTGSTTSDGFHIGVNNSTLNAFILQKENADLQFLTNDTERMRIASNGNLILSSTTAGGGTKTTFNVIENGGVVIDSSEGATARYIEFATGGTPKMFIAAAGNVGIGTASPSQRLEVAGVMRGEAVNVYGSTDPASTSPYLFSPSLAALGFGGNGSEKMRIFSDGNVLIQSGGTFSNNGAKLNVRVGSSGQTITGITNLVLENNGSANDFYVFQTATVGGGKSFSITNAGNVGIGTPSPSERLSVQGNTNLGNSFGNTLSSTFTTRISGFALRQDVSNRYGNYGVLILNSDSGWTGSARRFMITNGIGSNKFGIIRSVDANTDPALGDGGSIASGTVDFEINNAGAATFSSSLTAGVGSFTGTSAQALTIHKTSGGGSQLLMSTTFGNTYGISPFIAGVSNGGFSITDVTNNAQRIVIQDGTGNVGIGTTSPSVKLDVNGKIYSSTEVQANNAVINTTGGYATFGSNSSVVGVRVGRDASLNDIIINPSGNVTIGSTTDAGFKLDVNGTGRFNSTSSTPFLINTNTDNTTTIRTSNGGGNSLMSFENSGDANNAFAIGRSNSGDFVLNHSASSVYGGGTLTNYLNISSTGAATFSSSVTAGDVSFFRKASGAAQQQIRLLTLTNSYATEWAFGNSPGSLNLSAAFFNGSSWSSDFFTITTLGAATFSNTLTADGTLRTNSGIFQLFDVSSLRGGMYTYRTWLGSGTDYSTTLISQTNMYFCVNGTITRAMTIASNGNVLIGTTDNPGDLLRVNQNTFTNTITTYRPGVNTTKSDEWKLGRAQVGTQPTETHQIIVQIGDNIYSIGAALN